MWPFSRKRQDAVDRNRPSVAAALQQLETIGIRVREGIAPDDLLYSLGGTMDSPTDWAQLLCVLGSEVERGEFPRVSDDIWHFDAECIEDHGAYVAVVDRFVTLTRGALPLTNVRDSVEIKNRKAFVEFELDGQTIHWDLKVHDDWVDPTLYGRLQNLVTPRGAGRRFFIAGLGQDSLLACGDDRMRQGLSELSGLKFQWE